MWKPQPHWLNTVGWLSWSQRAVRVAPRDNVKVPPHPGMRRPHPRIRNPTIHTQLQLHGTKTDIPRADTAPQDVETQSHRLIYGSLVFMEPGPGESSRTGQRRGPAAPGDDKALSPDQKSFHTCTTPTTPETKTGIPRVDTTPHRGILYLCSKLYITAPYEYH